MADTLVSESISSLTGVVVSAIKTTASFKSELRQLQGTLHKITETIKDVEKLNQTLDQRSDMFDCIKDTEKLVHKCSTIKLWKFWKQYSHAIKLRQANNELLRFFQLEVQADQMRDLKQIRVLMESVLMDLQCIRISSSSSSSSSSRKRKYQMQDQMGHERGKLGWRGPDLSKYIVPLDEPLEKLKAKVFHESSVVVVAAAGGCGKTTLVTMLCHDHQIKGKFRENIFFVTVSVSPNFELIVNDLFNPSPSTTTIVFQGEEDAKNKLGNFFLKNVSSPVLLVLDDVWDYNFIYKFPLEIKGFKIVVTSRTTYPQFDVFEFDPLSDKDANILFRRYAFTESENRPTTTVREHLVDQMVICCKKHPLTLSVVGRSLNGKGESEWISKHKTLDEDSKSVLDLHNQVLKNLEKSFTTLNKELKECYMDFGLFPEDQKIPASTLLDMWVHLYNHDHGGLDTFDKIIELSYNNLINLVATRYPSYLHYFAYIHCLYMIANPITIMFSRKDSGAIVNYCDQQFVMQHDLLRELAIHLSSKPELPVAQRKRLIINAPGEDLPASISILQEPMQASILSISTGKKFSSRWCDMKVAEVKVMVLNLKSKTYTLPHFMKEMQKLEVLNVTNYGLYLSNIKNTHLLGCLSSLSRIRLEFVTISSLNVSILALQNLQKVSFIMCKIVNAFETDLSTSGNFKVWPSLVELEIDYCQDLKRFPGMLCDSVRLKTLSITNCNELIEISEEFGKLINLENVSLQSCTKLEKLPQSITRLQKLSILNISDCSSLCELPKEMGELGGLREIHMKGCTIADELPSSIGKLSNLYVQCNEEMYYQWCKFSNVKAEKMDEDTVGNLIKITK